MRKPLIYIVLACLCGTTLSSLAADEPAIKADEEATRAGKSILPAAPLQPPAGKAVTHSATTVPQSVPVFSNPETIVVAEWDGGRLTNKEVSATLTSRRPSNIRISSPEQLANMPRPAQIETVKQLAYEQLLMENARKAGFTKESPQIAAFLKNHEDDILNRLYYTHKIAPAMQQITEEAARDYYDEHKNTEFTQPGHELVRAVHISTFEMITAEEGDTLEKLAENISGDSSAAGNIHTATPPYYLRKTPTALEDKVLSSPLRAGEVLFVPFNNDRIASATAFAKNLREELVGGKSVDEVAAMPASDFTVSATQPLLFTPNLPYFDALKEAAKSLHETSVSQVVKTPTGLDILVLEDTATTQVIPYNEVKDRITQMISADEQQRRNAVEKVRQQTLDYLWSTYNVKINDEAISRPNYQGTDPLSTSTVIAETGDFKYTLEDYLRDLRLTGKDWGQLTRQERLDILKIAPTINAYLAAKDARAMGLDKTDEFRQMISGIAESEIVSQYLKTLAKPEDNHVSDAELRAFYNDHLDNYTSPAQVTIREIGKRINMTLPPDQKADEINKAKKSLEEIRSRIHSQEDFAQLARRESEAISTRSRGGLIGTVSDDFRGEAFKNQLRQLKPGDVSEPFFYGSEVMIIRMDDRIAPTVQPFENVRRQVMKDYARTVPESKREKERQKVLDAANFKLLF